MRRFNLLNEFRQVVRGFVDTLKIFKEVLSKRKSYKQVVLAAEFHISTDGAHNAVDDVRVLSKLVTAASVDQAVLLRHAKTVSQIIANENRLARKPTLAKELECLRPRASTSMISK